MKTSVITLVSILSVVFTLGTAQAAPKKTAATEDEKPAAAEKGEKAAPKKNTYPLYGEVVAVSPRILTIKGGEGKEDRKYAINTETRIHNNGKDVAADAITVGKKVGGLIEKSETGNDKMVSINVGVKQEAAARKPKAAASKKGEGKGEAEPAAKASTKKSA